MSDESILSQAWELYKRGRFSAALESLEPKVFQFRDDPSFFRVMGLCCLRLGDWKGGETYLQRSRQLEPTAHRETLLGLMAVAARRQDFGEAVRYGLEVLDQNPGDKTAKRGLGRLRTALSGDPKAPGLDQKTLGQWLPPYRKSRAVAGAVWVRLALGLGLVAAVVLGTWMGLGFVGAWASAGSREVPGSTAPLPGSTEAIQPGPGALITLTPEEVRATWERSQKAFQAYRDSEARYELNRLLLSNAGPAFKERARNLIPYLHEPDFARPEDSVPYQAVRSSPALYEGCTVRWSGVLTNLNAGETSIRFDLLLGYQNGQVVEGLVPVQLKFAALLKNSQVVEVLGRVAVEGNSWHVQGTSLRDLGYRSP